MSTNTNEKSDIVNDTMSYSSTSKLIVLREEKGILNNKEVTAEELKKVETKVGEILETLPEEEKKSVIFDIFQKVQNQDTLSRTVKEISGKSQAKNSKIDPNLFKKIYSEDYTETTGPKNLWEIITSEIVLRFVAFGLLLGMLFFFFQGLQPAILNQYLKNSQSQGDKLESRFQDQTSIYLITQNQLLNNFGFYTGDVFCSQLESYNKGVEDVDTVNRSKFNFFPDKKLKNLDTYNYASLQEVESKYNTLYTEYTNKLSVFSDNFTNLMEIPKFLNYRNVWLDTCVQIEKTPADLNLLQGKCTLLITKHQEFLTQTPSFWSQISQISGQGVSLCNTLSASTLKDFSKNFLTQFTLMMSFIPNFEKENTNLKTIISQFVDKKNSYNSFILDLQARYRNQHIYFLNYKFS